jgi:RNA polymerase sigma factor (sigma-70 family)
MTIHNASLVAQLFACYGKQLHSYLTRRINPHDVEDITQKTYLQLLQHPNLEEISNPQAYLFRTASNLAVDALRRDGTRSKYTDKEVDTDNISSPQPGVETLIDGRLEFASFIAALEELPELCRYAFVLNRLDGLGHAEIADRLGISKKTVQRYILKALEHCQQRLER